MKSDDVRIPRFGLAPATSNAPELDTEAPKGMVKVYPRRIDLENPERLRCLEATTVVESVAELEAAVAARPAWLEAERTETAK